MSCAIRPRCPTAVELRIAIQGANDAPVLAGDLAVEVGEGGTVIAPRPADLDYIDLDDTPAGVTYAIELPVTSGPVPIAVLVGGVPATSFTAQQVIDGLVAIQHDGSEVFSGSPIYALQIVVEDGNEDASVPAMANQIAFLTVRVDPVNDAPEYTGLTAFTVAENAAAFLGLEARDAENGLIGWSIVGPTNGFTITWAGGAPSPRSTMRPSTSRQLGGLQPTLCACAERTMASRKSGSSRTSQSISPTKTSPPSTRCPERRRQLQVAPTPSRVSLSPTSTTVTTTVTTAGSANGRLSTANPLEAAITGSGSSTVTVSGAIVAVNAALAGLVYTGLAAGSDTPTITTTDGAGGVDTDTIAVSVVGGPGVTITGGNAAVA